jgi:hypothetical protein
MNADSVDTGMGRFDIEIAEGESVCLISAAAREDENARQPTASGFDLSGCTQQADTPTRGWGR